MVARRGGGIIPQYFFAFTHLAEELSLLLFGLPRMGVFQSEGYLEGGPHNKDYSMLVSILECPFLGKLPTVEAQIGHFV